MFSTDCLRTKKKLCIRFLITYYDNNKREETKTLYYGSPVVVNTGQLHSAKGGETMTRYGFQLDFDYGMTINDVYDYYKSSPLFLQQ